jgi:hypothetical protein
MNKVLEQRLSHIDGERKFIGDLDIKIFHAIDNKTKLNRHQNQAIDIDWENIPKLDQDDSDYIIATSDSDNSVWDEYDWS